MFEPLRSIDREGRQLGKTTRMLEHAIQRARGDELDGPRDCVILTHSEQYAGHLRGTLKAMTSIREQESGLLGRIRVISCGGKLDHWRELVSRYEKHSVIYTEHVVWEMFMQDCKRDVPTFSEIGMMNRDARIVFGK
jgi:hypothetical protein